MDSSPFLIFHASHKVIDWLIVDWSSDRKSPKPIRKDGSPVMGAVL